ncbi:hypothetical protein HYZ76_01465, partial [Candidatus Falkowbacteria bacterium]|nr:hypothetical protein [Candidatus Falkowbacteria bacterium]
KREERQKANTVDPANLKNKDFSKLKGAPASDANKLSKSIEPGAGAGPSRLSEDEKREQFKKSSPATQQFLKDKGWAPKGQPELGQPAALPGGTSQSNGKTGQERKNEKQLKKERDRSKKEEGKKEDRKKNKGSEEPKQGKQVDAIGHIFFFGLLCFAIFIDALALFTGGASSVLDWIFDIGFAVAVAVVLFITTGDVIGSLVGKKGLVNATQTIVEFIPVIDVLPFHVLAVVILYLDLQYNILNKVTKLKGLKST